MFSRVSVCSHGVDISGHMSFPGVGISSTRSLLRGIQGVRGGYIRRLGTHSPDTWDIMGYGQQVGGTHPIGMLSCYICSGESRISKRRPQPERRGRKPIVLGIFPKNCMKLKKIGARGRGARPYLFIMPHPTLSQIKKRLFSDTNNYKGRQFIFRRSDLRSFTSILTKIRSTITRRDDIFTPVTLVTSRTIHASKIDVINDNAVTINTTGVICARRLFVTAD